MGSGALQVFKGQHGRSRMLQDISETFQRFAWVLGSIRGIPGGFKEFQGVPKDSRRFLRCFEVVTENLKSVPEGSNGFQGGSVSWGFREFLRVSGGSQIVPATPRVFQGVSGNFR